MLGGVGGRQGSAGIGRGLQACEGVSRRREGLACVVGASAPTTHATLIC